MATQKEPRVVLGVHRNENTLVLTKAANVMHDGMEADPQTYPAPNPPLAVFKQQLTAAEQANLTAAGGGKGKVAARTALMNVLWCGMRSQCCYVQTLCTGNPEHAGELVATVGMRLAALPNRDPLPLRLRQGVKPGLVHLAASAKMLLGKDAHKKSCFNWQYSTDGGKTWIDLQATGVANTELDGLTPLTTCHFRVRAVVGKVPGEWSQVVAFLVH